VVIGGAASTGFGSPSMPASSGESFSPVADFGSWSTIATDPLPARAFPQVTVLGSGNALVSGGLADRGARLNSGASPPPWAPARAGRAPRRWAAAPAPPPPAAPPFPDGPGAVLIGGLADGDNGPIGERLVGQSFSPYDLTGIENRQDATATALPS